MAPIGFVNNLRSIWSLVVCWVALVAQMVKNLPAMQETQGSIPKGWEDPLEKGIAIHCNILAWRILWTEEPGRLQSMGSQRVGHDRATNVKLHTKEKLHVITGGDSVLQNCMRIFFFNRYNSVFKKFVL